MVFAMRHVDLLANDVYGFGVLAHTVRFLSGLRLQQFLLRTPVGGGMLHSLPSDGYSR